MINLRTEVVAWFIINIRSDFVNVKLSRYSDIDSIFMVEDRVADYIKMYTSRLGDKT